MGKFIGEIIGFLTNFFVKSSKKLVSFSVVVGINVLILTFYLSFLTSFFIFLKMIYNKSNELISYILNYSSNEYLSLGIKVLKSVGIWDGLADGFKFVSACFVLLFVIILSKIIVKLLLNFRNSVLTLVISSK